MFPYHIWNLDEFSDSLILVMTFNLSKLQNTFHNQNSVLKIPCQRNNYLKSQNNCMYVLNISGFQGLDICWNIVKSTTLVLKIESFFSKVYTGPADIIIGDMLMNEPIYQIGSILSTNRYQMFQNRPAVCSLTDLQIDNKKTSSKYIIENNLIVYEKYDRYGELISRVPQSLKPIDEKA